MAHAETPWTFAHDGSDDYFNISITGPTFTIGRVRKVDDAALIIRAVNAHAKLVAACEEALEYSGHSHIREQLSTALSAAKECV